MSRRRKAVKRHVMPDPKFKDKIMVKKLNADENPTTAGNLGIRGLPTMMIFKNGECVGTKVGLVSENVISDWIDDTLV